MKKAEARQCQNGLLKKVYTAGTDGKQTVQKSTAFTQGLYWIIFLIPSSSEAAFGTINNAVNKQINKSPAAVHPDARQRVLFLLRLFCKNISIFY